eukprot:GHVU01202436.1.p1 GENE.GHVU01202436.1~~GHVU01202436.1.p1  ORF type:complete len:158 (+),score=4.45 GHVU01202436.1:298-771(+)
MWSYSRSIVSIGSHAVAASDHFVGYSISLPLRSHSRFPLSTSVSPFLSLSSLPPLRSPSNGRVSTVHLLSHFFRKSLRGFLDHPHENFVAFIPSGAGDAVTANTRDIPPPSALRKRKTLILYKCHPGTPISKYGFVDGCALSRRLPQRTRQCWQQSE